MTLRTDWKPPREAGSSDLEAPPGSVHVSVRLHDDGPALWPGYIPLSELEAAHRDSGTPVFETMYQGRRGGLAGQIIRPEWFRYFPGLPPGTTFMCVDPAISTKTTADETAIAVGNVSLDHTVTREEMEAGRFSEVRRQTLGLIYYRWIWHGRVGLREQESIIWEAWNYYRPVSIGIEAVAYQTALVQALEADHPELPIEPYTPTRDKLSRFLGLARLYEFGRVYHHPTMKGSVAEYQLTHLPGGRHDDIPDAMTGLAEMAGIATPVVVAEKRPEGFI